MPAGETLQAAATAAPLRGALYMIAAAGFFAVMSALARYGATFADIFELAFMRSAFGFVMMLPFLLHGGAGALRVKSPRLHLFRGSLSFIGTLCWFGALSFLPLAEAVSLNFTAPLFATVLAAIVLHEVVRARRWTATLVGFAGVMLVLRPGAEAISSGALLALGSAATIACNTLVVRTMMRTERAGTVVLTLSALLTVFTAVPYAIVCTVPSWELLALGGAMGLCGTLGHIAFSRSLAHAEASAVMPLDFARLPFAGAIGLVAFGELPDIWTIAGGLVIAGSAAYIMHREAVAMRRPAVPITGEAGR